MLGFVVAERARADAGPKPGPEQLDLLRALRSQILLALRLRTG
jgi:hypothetical protein